MKKVFRRRFVLRKPPKPGTRSKCWVGAHDRKVRGKGKKIHVKGHFWKIPKRKRENRHWMRCLPKDK